MLHGGDFQQRDQVVARGAERDVGRLFRESVVGLGEFRTYEQQFRFGVLCGHLDDCGVFAFGPVAQFEHVAQNQHPALTLFERLGEKIPDRSPHARRVGVVAVGDERVAGRSDALRAVVVGNIAGDGVADAFVGNVEIVSHGDGGRDVEPVVAAFQMVFDAVGQRCGVIFGGQRIAFGGHARQDFVVGRNEGVASVRREEVEQFALAAANPLRSAEAFEVRQADVGQDAVVRLGDRCQQSQFAAGARAHLHHAELRVAGHGEQRQRHADVVVEVAAGGVDLEPLGQHAADKLFRGGFAVAARDGEDRDSERPAVAAGKVLQGFQRVVDEHDALPLVGSGDLRIVGDGVGRAFFERFGDETVAVEGIAPQGEEDGVRLDPARVGRDTGVLAEKFV